MTSKPEHRRGFVYVVDDDEWGDDVSSDQLDVLCRLAEEYLTAHQGDHIRVLVTRAFEGDAPGLYCGTEHFDPFTRERVYDCDDDYDRVHELLNGALDYARWNFDGL